MKIQALILIAGIICIILYSTRTPTHARHTCWSARAAPHARMYKVTNGMRCSSVTRAVVKMISRKLYFFAVSLVFCCLKCCAAKNAPDLSDVAVDVISHLKPALQLLLSAEELSRWNTSVTEQQLTCIDDEVKDLLTRSAQSTDVSECSVSLEELFESVHITSGGSAELGSGSDDDTEEFSVGVLSEVFCNQACGSLLLSAYGTCGLFNDTVDKQLNDMLCRRTSKDELCLEVVASPSFPSALLTCTEKGCEESCKQGLKEFGCCLHFAVGSSLSEQCQLPECKEEDITNTAVATSSSTVIYILSVCFVSVILSVS